MREAKTLNGLVSDNALASIFQSAPQKASNLMIKLLYANRGMSLERNLMRFPVKYFETDDDYTWELIGSSRRNIALVEARYNGAVVEANDFNVGIGGSTIELVFPENYFFDGYIIVGEKNEEYPFRILEEPRVEGTYYVYKVELTGKNKQNGCPGEELVGGKRFSDEYAPVEREMSRKVGDVRYATPFSMRNEFSTIRISTKVAGNKMNRKLETGIPVMTKEGKLQVNKMWIHQVDWTLEEQFAKDKSHVLMYGVSNRDEHGEYYDFGKSGNVIKMGAGIREQMSYGNVVYYNKFDLKLLEKALVDLSVSKLDMKDRKFILRTGEYGAIQFNKAVLDVVSGWSAFSYLRGSDQPGIISKANSNLHQTALTAGFQFVGYRAPNNVEVFLEVDPFYDDPVRNKVPHPDGGVTESYRYDILYIGSTEEPNIQIAKIKGEEEHRGYQWGFRNPFTGQMNNNNMSFDEDSCVIHKMASLGAFILDAERTMSLIYRAV